MAGQYFRRHCAFFTTICVSILFIVLGPSFSQTRGLQTGGAGSFQAQFVQLQAEAEKARSEGRFEEALELSSQAYALAKKAENGEGKLDSLIQQGLLYWNLGRMKESSEAFARALPIAEKLQSPDKQNICSISLEIYGHYVQGKERRDSGDYQTSIVRFKKAVDLARAIQSKGQELTCRRQLSLTYVERKDFQEFFLLNKRGLASAQEIKHKEEEGRCLNNIGLFYWQIDDYTEALKNYEKALEIARLNNNLEEENNCLFNIGTIYMDLGNYERALEYFIQALESDKKLMDPINISKDLNNIGIIYERKWTISEDIADLHTSLKYYKEAMELAKRTNDSVTEIKVLNNIGSVYSYLGEYAKSLDYFQAALTKAQKAQDAEELSIILNNIGIVYAYLGNYEKSTGYYQRVIDLASEIKGKKVLWEAYFEIANAYKNQNELPAALENYRKSISVIENIRSAINLEELKATYLGSDQRIDVYHNIIGLFIRLYDETRQPGYAADAFRYLEGAKARAFLDSIEVSKLDLSKGVNQRLLNEETDLMNRISELGTKPLVPQLAQGQRDH